jgi:hypothetical protein
MVPAAQSNASQPILRPTQRLSGLHKATESCSRQLASGNQICTKRRPAGLGKMSCCSSLATPNSHHSGNAMAGSSFIQSAIRRPSGTSGCCKCRVIGNQFPFSARNSTSHSVSSRPTAIGWPMCPMNRGGPKYMYGQHEIRRRRVATAGSCGKKHPYNASADPVELDSEQRVGHPQVGRARGAVGMCGTSDVSSPAGGVCQVVNVRTTTSNEGGVGHRHTPRSVSISRFFISAAG